MNECEQSETMDIGDLKKQISEVVSHQISDAIYEKNIPRLKQLLEANKDVLNDSNYIYICMYFNTNYIALMHL